MATCPRRVFAEPHSEGSPGLRLGYFVDSLSPWLLDEIEEVRRQGASVATFSVVRLFECADPQAESERRVAHYLPAARRDLLRTCKWLVRRRPRVLRDVARALRAEGLQARNLLLAGWQALQAERLHLTHLHAVFATRPTTLAYCVSRLTGVPYSFSTHAFDIFRPNPSLPWKTAAAQFMRTISEFNRRHILETCPGVSASKIHVVRLGVAVDTLEAVGRNTPIRTPPDLTCVARLVEKKGHADLIAACGLLRADGRNVTCSLLGGGQEEARLRLLARTLGVDQVVRFLGDVPHDETLRQLAGATALVLPAVDARSEGGDMDGIPVVLMEAMALGVPVISCPVSGIPELVTNHVTGLLVPPRNPAAVAAAVASLLEHASLRDGLVSHAKARVRGSFDLSQNTAAFLRLFSVR